MAHVPGPKKIIKIVGATNLLKKVHFDEMIRFMIVLVNVAHKSGHLKSASRRSCARPSYPTPAPGCKVTLTATLEGWGKPWPFVFSGNPPCPHEEPTWARAKLPRGNSVHKSLGRGQLPECSPDQGGVAGMGGGTGPTTPDACLDTSQRTA